jgi:hypothetical protein
VQDFTKSLVAAEGTSRTSVKGLPRQPLVPYLDFKGIRVTQYQAGGCEETEAAAMSTWAGNDETVSYRARACTHASGEHLLRMEEMASYTNLETALPGVSAPGPSLKQRR